MGELKSRTFRREDGFFTYIRNTEVRVTIPVNISKIPSSDIWGFFNLVELHRHREVVVSVHDSPNEV